MPPQHRFYAEWNPQEMINRAQRIGNDVRALVEKVLNSTRCMQQAFKICVGIIGLSRRYGPERLNQASNRALEFNYYSYKAVKNILERGLDTMQEERLSFKPLPVHKNIRGSAYFN